MTRVLPAQENTKYLSATLDKNKFYFLNDNEESDAWELFVYASK
jgi:hypothetical protein